MLKRFTMKIDLPDELASRAKESLVMEFLRERRISQGKAAETLGISRDDLFPS